MEPDFPSIPFPKSYWVAPGRLLAGEYPGALEPDQAEPRIAALFACGIRHIVNLMEAEEVNSQGLAFAPYIGRMRQIAAEHGEQIGWTRFAIPDGSIPAPALMRQILDTIDEAAASGRPVYVHCWGGKGRTGTVVGCYLIRHKLATSDTALGEITRLRQNIRPFQESPETEEQRAFVRAWREDGSRAASGQVLTRFG